MDKLLQDKINVNYEKWIDRLKKYGIYSDEMINDIGDAIKTSPFGLSETSGSAYEGALIDITLNMLCVLAVNINNNVFKKSNPLLKVENRSLVRVLLMQHISKAVMFTKETDQWKVQKGYPYKFNDTLDTIMKCGERSIYLCMRYGIKLTEEEFEAIRIIDKDEEKVTSFSSPLSTIVKIANQLVVVEIRRKWLSECDKKT